MSSARAIASMISSWLSPPTDSAYMNETASGSRRLISRLRSPAFEYGMMTIVPNPIMKPSQPKTMPSNTMVMGTFTALMRAMSCGSYNGSPMKVSGMMPKANRLHPSSVPRIHNTSPVSRPMVIARER